MCNVKSRLAHTIPAIYIVKFLLIFINFYLLFHYVLHHTSSFCHLCQWSSPVVIKVRASIAHYAGELCLTALKFCQTAASSWWQVLVYFFSFFFSRDELYGETNQFAHNPSTKISTIQPFFVHLVSCLLYEILMYCYEGLV